MEHCLASEKCARVSKGSPLGTVGKNTIFFLPALLEMLFVNEMSVSVSSVPAMHLKPPKLTLKYTSTLGTGTAAEHLTTTSH